MDEIWKFVARTPEYRMWGWNAVTMSFVLTVFLTLVLQLPALTSQARKIWRSRRAEGVYPLTFITFFTYFVVFLAYGFSISSGAGVFNSLALLVPQLFILAGVGRFKGFTGASRYAAVGGGILIVLAFALPHKEVFFTIASIATFIGLLLQPLEMRKRGSEDVSLWFPLNFLIVTITWTVYGWSIGDTFLAGASFAFALVYAWMLAIKLKHRSGRKPASHVTE